MAATKPTKDSITQYYKDKKWNERMVRAAVVSGIITKEECEAILADDTKSTKTTTKKSTSKKKTTTKKSSSK